jgi:hypothetical protein
MKCIRPFFNSGRTILEETQDPSGNMFLAKPCEGCEKEGQCLVSLF